MDALAVAKVVAELRNWLHHGTCKLMYTRGGLSARSLGEMGPGATKPREMNGKAISASRDDDPLETIASRPKIQDPSVEWSK